MKTEDFLTVVYKKATEITKSKAELNLPKIITSNVDNLINKIDKNKSLLSALVTSILQKSLNPKQDIRLHRKSFVGGYSARTLDTLITAPFFKLHYPKYANKESGFLTMATRENIKWTLKDGINLKIRDKVVKESFLELIDYLQNNKISPEEVLLYIFCKLNILTAEQKVVFDEALETADYTDVMNINTVLKMISLHFDSKVSSRLPVIAIYTVYQQLFKAVARYDNKTLIKLNVHTSSDKHGFGDIEIWNKDKTPYEMVEIKHNIPIDRNMIFDVVKKSKDTTIQRYYVLTTSPNNFLNTEEEEYINKFILSIKKEFNLEIIPNGILNSLKYYLRFVDDYNLFIKNYTINLIEDSKNSTEVNETHIKIWLDILKKYHC